MEQTERMMTNEEEIAHLEKMVKQLRDKLRETSHRANYYDWLHGKEILIATPEGFKHFNHGELTEYIKAEMAKDWGMDADKLTKFVEGRKRNGDDT